MIQMIKREYVLNKLFFLSVYLLFPFIYLVNISPIFMYFGIILGYIFNLFYYDHHNQLNHFIVSLPIKKSNIVLGRYASSFTFMTVSLLYLWLIDTLAHYAFSLIEFLPTIEYKPITASTIIGTFILITIAVTVSMPIYYFFQ